MTNQRIARYQLQELIDRHWIAFGSDDIEYFVVSVAKGLSQFGNIRFRVWDSVKEKIVWPEKKKVNGAGVTIVNIGDHEFTDDRNYVVFDKVVVLRRCPKCCKFIKEGEVFINGLEQVRLTGWICKTHGEIKPEFNWTGKFYD